MREKERKREVFIGCRCAFFLLFLSVSSLFFGGHWIQFNPFLRLFSQSERQRANESETPETRNLRRATKEHLPLAERNKERKKDRRRRCSHHRLKNVLKRTGTSSMCFSGVTSAPKGTTHFCADWRSSGHAFKENRTPSLFSRSDQPVVIITSSLISLLRCLYSCND